MKRIETKLYRIFRKLGVSAKNLSSDTNLREHLNFDEYEYKILMFYLEAEFHIQISKNDIYRFNTVGSTVNYIGTKYGMQPAFAC